MIEPIEFLELAYWFGNHSTCRRLHVGTVLVLDRRIVSTGYNGAPAGLPHCTHDDMAPCERAVHAEANAIAFAAKNGVSTNGTVLYSTHAPCMACAQLIINAGIDKVIYGEAYRKTEGTELLEEAGVVVAQVDRPEVPEVSPAQGYRPGVYTCEQCHNEYPEGSPHMCSGSPWIHRGADGSLAQWSGRPIPLGDSGGSGVQEE